MDMADMGRDCYHRFETVIIIVKMISAAEWINKYINLINCILCERERIFARHTARGCWGTVCPSDEANEIKRAKRQSRRFVVLPLFIGNKLYHIYYYYYHCQRGYICGERFKNWKWTTPSSSRRVGFWVCTAAHDTIRHCHDHLRCWIFNHFVVCFRHHTNTEDDRVETWKRIENDLIARLHSFLVSGFGWLCASTQPKN